MMSHLKEDAKLFAKIHSRIYSTTEVVVGISFETSECTL